MSMRRSRALVLSLLFSFTLGSISISAAPNDGSIRHREVPRFAKIIKRLVKLVILPLSDTMSLPRP